MAIQSLFILIVLLFRPATSGEKYVKYELYFASITYYFENILVKKIESLTDFYLNNNILNF